MARPLRIAYEGATYHVMNRGNGRRRVFHSARYYELFLDKLGLFAEQFNICIRSYCLMPKHFHLYLQTPDANLSRFMQSFLTSFTIVSNRWRQSSGHVFQGRFKAILVEDERYGSIVSRYIHLNPVRIKALEEAKSEEKVRRLYRYKWSSFPLLTGACAIPGWFDSDATWERWGSSQPEQMRNYATYVEEGLSISLASPMDDCVAGAILGSKIFIDQVLRQDLLALSAATDQPASHVLVGNFPPCAIIDEIAQFFEISAEFIIHRRGANRLARLSAIHCVAYYCRAHYSQAKMAGYFQLSAAGFISAKIRARRLEGKDANTLKQVEQRKPGTG